MKSRVLIVEDSMTDYIIMKSLLKRADLDYRIFHNTSGKNVVKQVLEDKIDIVVLDLVMDGVDGINVLQELKECPSTVTLPVIVCSSLGDKETIKKVLELGADDFFEKPLSDLAIEFGFALKVKNALISKEREESLNYLRTHDDLTGLYTRKYLEMELTSLIEDDAFPLGVIMLDINGLRVINQAYGHDYGDEVLRGISNLLREESDESWCLARWGSDELILLMPKVTYEHVDQLIFRLEGSLESNKKPGYHVTFGWAIEEEDAFLARSLVQKAEEQLFSNKILESNNSRSTMIDTIIKTLHQKNPREEMHSHRVSVLCEEIAKELTFSSYEVKKVKVAGLLHDIGKISIDEAILNKAGRLSDLEWDTIKKHPEHGFKILSTSVDTMEIAKAILAHHERWNGSGYPKGLKQDEIPILARIISVADAFDAMTSARPYKRAMSTQEAVEEIERCSGSQFDPTVVEALLTSLGKNKMGTYSNLESGVSR